MSETPSRDDNETTTTQRRCPVCATTFTPVRRQRYDTNACRQIAYRRRHDNTLEVAPVPVGPRRRATTVYWCAECESRYLGEQWCPDCNRPCRRVGPGGSCPNCEEPVAISDLAPASESD